MPALRAKRGSGGAQRGSRAVAPAWAAVIEGRGSGSPVTKSPTAGVNVTDGLADGAGFPPSRAKRGDGGRAARSACGRAGVGCWHRGREGQPRRRRGPRKHRLSTFWGPRAAIPIARPEEHTSELQSHDKLV